MGRSIQKLSSVTRVGLDLAKKVFQVHAVGVNAWRASPTKPLIVWISTFALSVLMPANVIVVITIPCLERRPRGELICPVWTAEPDANPGCDAFLDTCTPPRSSTEGLERRLTLNGRNRPIVLKNSLDHRA